MGTPKETIGVKVPAEWKEQIKQLAEGLGLSPSEWLYSVVGEALGKADVNRVNSLVERVEALEKKLTRLAS